MNRHLARLTVVCTFMAGSAAPALASQFGVPAGYKLEMATIERCFGAYEKVMERALKDPKLKAEMVDDGKDDGKDDPEMNTVNDLVKAAEKKAPRSVAMMKEFGCAMREYATMLFATTEAAVASATLQAGEKLPPEYASVPRENIELLRKNTKRIEALRQRMEEAERKIGLD